MKLSSLGIHIALSKYPLGKESEFIENLQKLYHKYREKITDYLKLKTDSSGDIDEKYKTLYEPAVLHMYSHFDVGFVSLVDNFKFPQRVFEPLHTNEEEEKIKSVSYQILSGAIIETDRSPDPAKILKPEKDFLKIIQLKLNNGLLIGNGAALFNNAISLVEDLLVAEKIEKYVLVNSYNWGEITILCAHDYPQVLATFLMRVRLLTLRTIPGQQAAAIEENSLYKKWGVDNIMNAHLFSETLSYLGADFFNYKEINPATPFLTNIEWQIKPGHFPQFAREMENSPLDFSRNYGSAFFKNGKTDYLVYEKSPETIASNIEIFKILRNNPQLRSHVRKIKTKPLFRIETRLGRELKKIADEGLESPCSTEASLANYKIKNGKDVAKCLRRLNVSRNVRKKVSKIIYNYNLGIQDPILCIYFIDLYKLLRQFIDELQSLSSKIEEATRHGVLSEDLSENDFGSLKTKFIQKELIEKYIDVFEEAFQDRILNNYNYEDINEFSLDINSSLTGIVSSFDAIIKFFGSCFRDGRGDSIVTTINDNETVSNKLSVNYNIEHITSTPLVFATLVKEILNIEQGTNDIKNSDNFSELNDEFNAKLESNPEIDNDTLFDFLKAYKFAYFEIDFKKYHLTFLKDTDLYIFWHWTYALQCTHLYSSVGYFDELSFTRELFRLLLLLKAVESSKITDLCCPIPELRTYWDKYFNRVLKIVEKVDETRAFKKMTRELSSQVYKSINSLNSGIPAKGTILKLDINLSTTGIFERIKGHAIVFTEKGVDDFITEMHKEIEMARASSVSGVLSKSSYFKILTYISYYNLWHIYRNFGSQIRLLRRDFLKGSPVDHFLRNDIAWYIDPFGGFFINDTRERELYMNANNKMLYLLWHIGTILKKEIFF